MAHLYILKSQTADRFYIGSTNDLVRRLSEHARGHSAYTRGRGPWILVYQEAYESLPLARQRERQVKSWKSRQAMDQLIAGSAHG
ncbi:MAG: GIY-YIG nuclease family protein [Acidobacteria bacterium]|nr:GIY-YIG nuclease family protein [Acidobacteriota bacterium]